MHGKERLTIKMARVGIMTNYSQHGKLIYDVYSGAIRKHLWLEFLFSAQLTVNGNF